MAELLVRVKDKVNSDFYLNCQCTKRGDVIVAVPDGWNWGNEELTLPFYRILKVPGLAIEDAVALTAPEPADSPDPRLRSKTLQRRLFKIDLDSLAWSKADADFLADDKRQAAAATLVMQPQALLALKVTKAKIADPAVIGAADAVIG